MSAEAMLRHEWWSLRRRCAATIVVVAVNAVLLAAGFGYVQAGGPAGLRLSPEDRAALDGVTQGSYAEYLRQGWAGGDLAGLLVLIAIVLAVGGAAAERREDTADLTLALPVPRFRWLLVRGGLVMAMVLGMALLSAAIVIVVGLGGDHTVPLGTVATTILLAGLGPAYATAIGLLASTMTRESIAAALIAVVLVYVLGGLGRLPDGWAPDAWHDIGAWAGRPPWRSLATSGAVAVAALGAAGWRFRRSET